MRDYGIDNPVPVRIREQGCFILKIPSLKRRSLRRGGILGAEDSLPFLRRLRGVFLAVQHEAVHHHGLRRARDQVAQGQVGQAVQVRSPIRNGVVFDLRLCARIVHAVDHKAFHGLLSRRAAVDFNRQVSRHVLGKREHRRHQRKRDQ